MFAVAVARACYPQAQYGSPEWDIFETLLLRPPTVDPSTAAKITEAWIDHHQMPWYACVTQLYGCDPTELIESPDAAEDRAPPPPRANTVAAPTKSTPDATFELGNRDENGILCGSLKQGWLSYPIVIRRSIVPFLYPCQQCKAVMFHVLGEQHAGLVLKVPLLGPVASSGKGYQAICNDCTMINTLLPYEVVQQLEQGIIAPQIFGTYARVCEPPLPYTDGFAEQFVMHNSQRDETALALIRQFLNAYRREHVGTVLQ